MVIRLPQWMGFSNLNPNYMESLQVHQCIHLYQSIISYEAFKQKYFEEFHVFPDQAFWVAGLIKWISNVLSTSG